MLGNDYGIIYVSYIMQWSITFKSAIIYVLPVEDIVSSSRHILKKIDRHQELLKINCMFSTMQHR